MSKVAKSKIDVALGSLKTSWISIRTQWNFQVTLNLGLQLPSLQLSHLEPDSEIKLHINIINPSTLLRIKLRKLISPKQNQVPPLKHGVQFTRSLMPLIKGCQKLRIEPLVLIVGPGLDFVVVDSDLLVGVSDSDVEGKIVLEIVVFGEIELGQRGFIDIEVHFVGSEDQPKDENSKANDDNQGDYEFQKEA